MHSRQHDTPPGPTASRHRRDPAWMADEPTISEAEGIRYLHFDTPWAQGAMKLRDPAALVFDYTQQMMAWLLFLEPSARDHVGILGLGAGSLLRFTLKHTPAQLATVEWNPRVTAVCEQYFRLPRGPRCELDHDDAQTWLMEPRNVGRYLALMVDLYDGQAQGPVRDSVTFYRRCHRALADTGVMTVNLFGHHQSYGRNLDNIREAFGGRVLELPELPEGNRIVIGLKGPVLDVAVGDFMARAADIEAACRLPARRWARALLAQGGGEGRMQG